MPGPEFTAGFAAEVDWPQTQGKDPPGYHEALWTWGYDPAAGAGYNLYLLHDPEDETLRHERVTLYLPDGAILRGAGQGRRSAGRVAAGEGLALECVEPFREWLTRYQGRPAPIAWDDPSPMGDVVPVRLWFAMEAGAPAWNVEGDWGEPAPNVRFHQLYRVYDGELVVGARHWHLDGTALRGHSRRARDHSRYTGHAVATALFEDDRAFGLFCFFGDGTRLRSPHGYVVLGGVRYDAIVEELPPIHRKQRNGEPLRFVLTGDFGRTEITGETVVTTFAVPAVGPQAGLVTSTGIARYVWSGQVAYGPIDRCHTAAVVEGL